MSDKLSLAIEFCEDLPTQAKCYSSHEAEIEMICHICGRPMKPTSKHFRQPMHRRKLLHLLSQSKKPSRIKTIWNHFGERINPLKFRKYLGFDLHPNEPVYCKNCASSFYWRRIVYILSIIGFWIIKSLTADSESSWVKFLSAVNFLLMFGLVVVTWAYLRNELNFIFPIIGRMPKIMITEQIKGSINLFQDGSYQGAILGEGQGRIKFGTKLTAADIENSKRCRKKSFRRLIVQNAGFLIFQQKKDLEFFSGVNFGEDYANTVLLKKSESFEGLNSNFWEDEMEYNFSCVEQDKLPVQLIPNIISEGGDHTALELTVQIRPEDKCFAGAKASVVSLKIEDINAGTNTRTFPPSTPGSTEWKRISLVQDNIQEDRILWIVENKIDGSEITRNIKKYSRATFYVRFQAPINQNMQLRGSLELTFDKLFSQLDCVQLFSPLGYKIDPKLVSVKKETQVFIDFCMDFQSLQIKIPFSRLAEEDTNGVPDHKLVNQLVERLSERQDVYVQRVIENPPATNKATAMILNRFWEISGRFYEKGLFPVDFRILITGKEEYERGQEEPVCGKLHFEITVNATVVKGNSSGSEKFFQELHEVVKQIKNSMG